ncbi:glycosyltransferase [Daejeonella oryzae]|uniref:glycosyltransferase n=1 Tax=Daejeonella oryzae TaxID=1122943 RepID=UPI0004287115|nr:glycosyltransferase [Daejeonella oryzae]
MRIIHLNTYAGNGGAGKACLRINKALQDQQIDSQVYVNFLFQENKEVHNLSRGFFPKWFAVFGILLERIVSKFFTKSLPVPFSVPVWGRNLSAMKFLKNADIIHIHWINHAFLKPADLRALAVLNKPVVWTFHDSNAFTGGCHVRYSCINYKNECGECPLLKKPSSNDLSHRIWLSKEKAYRDLKLNIVAPSNWMAASVHESKLLGSRPVQVIPNTLDTQVFKPWSKSEARKKLGLPADKFILMSGFMPSRKDMHKGTPYLLDAFTSLMANYQIEPGSMHLVIFGNRDAANVPDFEIPATFLGTIAEEEKLALCYSAADVFISSSLEDNLPYTVMESLACGTPVVAFTTGGIPDMVEHMENGYLAEYKSSGDLAAGINWMYAHPDRQKLNAMARKTVEDHFSEERIARKHIQLYQSLINKSNVQA